MMALSLIHIFMFTPGNVDDREPLKQGKFLENINGKLCADKGYIGQALFENLSLIHILLLLGIDPPAEMVRPHQGRSFTNLVHRRTLPTERR